MQFINCKKIEKIPGFTPEYRTKVTGEISVHEESGEIWRKLISQRKTV
jgi:hypothetical protein